MIGAPTDHDAPTTQTQIGAPATNQCANCGSPLAADQHYCLTCGERRGKPRFSATALAPPTVVEEHHRAVATAARPSRATSGVAFLGTVLVLLIALGVGVLIGHNNNSTTKAAAGPQVIKIDGGGGGGTGASSGTAATTNAAVAPAIPKVKATAHQTKAQVKKILKVISAPVTAKEAAKASNAAKSVLGGSQLPTSTVKVGQAASGPGSQNGQFTGNFFGQ